MADIYMVYNIQEMSCKILLFWYIIIKYSQIYLKVNFRYYILWFFYLKSNALLIYSKFIL